MIVTRQFFSQFYAFFLLLCAVLNCYDGPFGLVRLSLFILFPFCFIYFIIFFNINSANKKINAMLIYAILLVMLSIITFLDISFSVAYLNVFGRVIILFFSIISIYVSIQLLDLKNLIFWCKFFSIFVVGFLIFQFIWFYVSGNVVSGKLPFLTIHNDQDKDIVYKTISGVIYRPTSFFLEPSQIGLFLALTFNVILFYCNNVKDKLYYIILFFVGSVFSTSGTAFGLVIITLFIYLISLRRISFAFKFCLYICIFIISILLFLNYDKFHVFSRFIESQNRFFSYIEFFNNLDTFQRLFGVGIGNNVSFFSNTLNMDWGFVSGFGLLLLQFGYIGIFLSIIFYVYLFSILPNRCKPLLLIYLVAMSFENLLYGYWMIVYFSIFLVVIAYGDKNATIAVNCNTNQG